MNKCYQGDALEILKTLPDEHVQTCVTSPPYWGLRDYGVPGQLGLEPTPEEYVARMAAVFREVRRVLREDGTLWLNLGDSYAAVGNGIGSGKQLTNIGSFMPAKSAPPGLKPKDLVGIPWRVAFALQADGWYLRSDIIWAKPNPMPESVTDRPTRAHEYLFLLSKSARYYYDAEAIAEASVSDHPSGNGYARPEAISRGGRGQSEKWSNIGGSRNRRSVWTVATQPYPEAHFAVFPPKLIEPCVLAGAPSGGVVLDPFMGSGTTAQVAQNLGRQWIGIELNPDYIALQSARTAQQALAI